MGHAEKSAFVVLILHARREDAIQRKMSLLFALFPDAFRMLYYHGCHTAYTARMFHFHEWGEEKEHLSKGSEA